MYTQKERRSLMVKTEEKLKKEVGKLYLFANLMYGDALNSIGKNKTIGFEEERLLEHIKKSINKSIESYFKDFKIDEKLFKDFNEMQRKHLVNLSNNIDAVQENAVKDIIEELFTPLGDDETIDEKERSLESMVEKIINSTNHSIESINRQIGYCMVLYSYANKGYKKYRLKPGSTACNECKEKGRNTYSIEKLKDAEYLPLVHPNCRCTIEILDDKNKAVATVDSKAIEEQLGKTESTKGMGFLDYISALLSAAALIPGIDSVVDLISIPVDLLRGDLISVGFDLLGIVPFVGEVGDAGKALRIADKVSDVTNVAKTAENIADGVKLVDSTSDIIKTAKRSPIEIPKNATVKEQAKNGYSQIKYTWQSGDYKYTSRWHTQTPNAPAGQGTTWVVERKRSGIGYGKNPQSHKEEILVGENKWISRQDWKDAITARKQGTATKQQKEWLDNGHWKDR
jgi:hypothetical protein